MLNFIKFLLVSNLCASYVLASEGPQNLLNEYIGNNSLNSRDTNRLQKALIRIGDQCKHGRLKTNRLSIEDLVDEVGDRLGGNRVKRINLSESIHGSSLNTYNCHEMSRSLLNCQNPRFNTITFPSEIFRRKKCKRIEDLSEKVKLITIEYSQHPRAAYGNDTTSMDFLVQHSMIYLGDNLVLSKNGYSANTRPGIYNIKDIIELYKKDSETKKSVFFNVNYWVCKT